jgi:hypothetical protein
MPFNKRILMLLSFGSLWLACGDMRLESLWLDRKVTVDGSDTEWDNARVYLEKANVSVGVLNDSQTLAFCLISMDRSIEQEIRQGGLVIRFKPEGEKKNSIGIRYPVGLGNGGPPEDDDGASFGRGMPDFSRSPGMLPVIASEIEVFGPDDSNKIRLPSGGGQGIEARIGESAGRFVYELKVPLVRTSEFPRAIGDGTSKMVTMELETFESAASRPGEGMRPPSGGRRPPGGDRPEGIGDDSGMDGGPGGGGPGGRPGRIPEGSRAKSLKYNVNIILAGADSSQSNGK